MYRVSGLSDINVGGIDIPTPDVSTWDWHEYALAAIVGFVAVKWIAGTGRKAKRAVTRPFKERAVKQKRIQSAREKYEKARGEAGLFGF